MRSGPGVPSRGVSAACSLFEWQCKLNTENHIFRSLSAVTLQEGNCCPHGFDSATCATGPCHHWLAPAGLCKTCPSPPPPRNDDSNSSGRMARNQFEEHASHHLHQLRFGSDWQMASRDRALRVESKQGKTRRPGSSKLRTCAGACRPAPQDPPSPPCRCPAPWG